MRAEMEIRHQHGKTFRDARTAKGLTLKQVSKHVGVSLGQIRHYESGLSLPPFDKLVRLCALLEIELNDLAKAA
jgi:transcriptional regulator with XRE-family HTH domain